MDQNDIMDQRTIFRHGTSTSDELMDIINYLESQLPGTRVQVAEAIRYAIAGQANRARQQIELNKRVLSSRES